ncbi:MAG: mevalonate 3,5-bisphosphate decarboxylase [Candidatus Micrarchaeaceae archaeon]
MIATKKENNLIFSNPLFDEKTLKTLNSKGIEILKFVKSNGLYQPLKSYAPNVEDGRITYGEGYPITAIEKFLGYYDKSINIAFSPSISITTDFSVVQCFCKYVDKPNKDIVILDGESDERYTKRAKKALDTFRSVTGIVGSFQFTIRRIKRYEHAKGLGESAAVAAATSRALIANVFGDEPSRDDAFVSRFARLVSGSGTRSATGGMSLWVSFPGINEEDSRGFRLPVDTTNLHFVVFPDFHTIQTMDAHGIASSSPFYPIWIGNKYDRILKLLNSGLKLSNLMQNAQEDMFFLRSLLTSGGVIIDTERSLELISAVNEFRKDGGNIFMTADTGPSIVVMSDNRKELDRFISAQTAKPIEGQIIKRVEYVPDKQELAKAELFFDSL